MDGSVIPAFVTALAGTLTGGGIVAFLLKDRLDEQRQLRQDHAALKREVETEHKTLIANNSALIHELEREQIRMMERLTKALETLDRVDFGMMTEQLRSLNRNMEIVAQQSQRTVERVGSLEEGRKVADSRIDRAHERISKISREAAANG